MKSSTSADPSPRPRLAALPTVAVLILALLAAAQTSAASPAVAVQQPETARQQPAAVATAADADAAEPVAATAPYQFVLAKMLAAEGELVAAGRAFEEALRLAPEEPFVHLEYAGFLARMASVTRGDRKLDYLQQAVDAAQKARDLAGDEPEVWRTLAQVYLDLAREQPAALADARQAMERVVAADPDDLETSLTLGQIYLSEGQPEQAVELFSRVAERSSGNRYVDSLLSEALMRTGRQAEAEGVLGRLLSLDPGARQVRLGVATLQSGRGDHAAALATLQAAPPSLRAEPEIQRRIALELHLSGHPDAALAMTDKLRSEDPATPGLLTVRALALASLGRSEELYTALDALPPQDPQQREIANDLEVNGQAEVAQQVLRRALERAQAAAGEETARAALELRVQLAGLLSRNGDPAAAAQVVEPLTRVAPGEDGDDEAAAARRRRASLARATFLEDAQRGGEALALLSALDAETPQEERTVQAMTAELMLADGREAEARAALDALAAEGPEAALLAARAAQSQQRFDLSIPFLEPLAAEPDAGPDVLFLLGAAYERSGRRADAETVFRRLLAAAPDFAPALNYLGYMFAERGESLPEALTLIRRAVAADPDEGSYVDSLGWVHHQLGEQELALRYLQRAATLSPRQPEIYEHLGDVETVLGNAGRAGDAYRRALELSRDDPAQTAELEEKLRRLTVE